MSLYQVQKLLFQLHNDLELRKRYKADTRAVLKGYDLSDPETKVLLEADVGSLYRMGVHSYLLWSYGRLMGVAVEDYFKQIGGG